MLQLTPETIAYLKRSRANLDEREFRKAARRAKARTRPLPKPLAEQLRETVAPVLRDGEPTRFRFEATCVQAVRVYLIARGYSWADANDHASSVVGAALKQIGARRPSWLQGQPEWRESTHSRHGYCGTCSGPLDEDTKDRFCSAECRRVSYKLQWQRDNREKMTALQAAWRRANPDKVKAIEARTAAKFEVRPCKHCSKPFQLKPIVKFCTPKCGYEYRKAEAALRKQRRCDHCGVAFPARNRFRKNYYCSKPCSHAAKRAVPAATSFRCEEAL